MQTRFSKIAPALLLATTCLLAGCRGLSSVSGGGSQGSGGLGGSQLPPTNSAVKRIIVVILQNRSFDHLFGTFTGAEGPHPGVPGYSEVDSNGNTVTPFLLTDLAPKNLPEGRKAYLAVWNNGHMDQFAANNGDQSMGYYDGTTPGVSTLWTYAQQFALADHFFQSVLSEAPTNQMYLVAAQDNNFDYPVDPFYGPCNKANPAAKPYTFMNVGDELTAKGIAWELFQENYGVCGSFNPLHDPFQFFTTTNNTPHIADFSQFGPQLASDTLPAVTFVVPGPTHDMHPGGGSIVTSAAWLDRLVQEVQSAPAWSSVAIVVTFDDGGGWYDHVPPPLVGTDQLGFRVPLLVISPLSKKGYISKVQMDHVSILKYIQWNWSLPSLNPRNDASNDISDMFQ